MTNILITSAGQRVSLVRAFQEELKKINSNNKVFTIDTNPILAPACHISDGCKAAPKVTDETYIPFLINVCKQWNIRIIIPTIDTELITLSKNIDLINLSGIQVIISDIEFIQICRDKRLTNQFFCSVNIDTPKILNKESPTFPLFIKPYDGSLSKDTFIINDKKELTNYHLNNPKLIFMEYINHEINEEYTVDTYYDKNHKLICVVPRKRIFVRSGEINKGVTVKNQIIPLIRNNLNYIPGARGCLTMQFFFNIISKRIVGIEINPRFGGGYPLSYLAGANFPKNIINEYIFNKPLIYSENWEDRLLMLRYDDEILVHGYYE